LIFEALLEAMTVVKNGMVCEGRENRTANRSLKLMEKITLIGSSRDSLPTPALILDADIFESNIKKMQSLLAAKGVSLRAHAKTHKSPAIGQIQMKAGAVGLCCATLAEAEAMVQGGLDKILITSQIAGDDKARRLASLAAYADISIAVDCRDNIAELSQAALACGSSVGIIVEVDVGMGRCGVRSPADAVLLAQEAVECEGLSFRGLMGYEGHAVFLGDRDVRQNTGLAANRMLLESAEAVRSKGIPVEIVSAAGTGTYDIASEVEGITEIQAGSYIFMDLAYEKLGLPFEIALTVLSTVISRPDQKTAVLDCGMKSISVEREMPRPLGYEGMEIFKLAEEHALARINPSMNSPLRGEKVSLIPSHCCTTVNLHDSIYLVRDRRVEAVWPISARGIH
jgi:D-serine deaminase-like pyridoxal phosphate-dependent protein